MPSTMRPRPSLQAMDRNQHVSDQSVISTTQCLRLTSYHQAEEKTDTTTATTSYQALATHSMPTDDNVNCRRSVLTSNGSADARGPSWNGTNPKSTAVVSNIQTAACLTTCNNQGLFHQPPCCNDSTRPPSNPSPQAVLALFQGCTAWSRGEDSTASAASDSPST